MGRRARWASAAAAGAVLAGASLRIPAAPTFDAWVWMSWGRQLRAGSIDVAGPTAWKPFTAAAGLALTPFGDGAITAWLLVVRLAFVVILLAVAAAAAGLSTRPGLAVAFAVVSAATLRNLAGAVLGGASEVVLCALVAGAVALLLPRLAGRTPRPRAEAAGVALLAVAGTIRPEVWPVALASVLLLPGWRRLAGLAGVAAMVGVWFLPVKGMDAEQVRASPLAQTTGVGSVLVDAVTAAPAALVLGAVAVAAAVHDGRRRAAHGGHAVLALAAAAALVAGVAAAEGALGYPALARFVLVCGVLVAIAAAGGVDPIAAVGRRAVVPAVLLVAVVLAGRVVDETRLQPDRSRRAEEVEDVRAVLAGVDPALLGPDRQVCVGDERLRAQVAFLTSRPVRSVCSDAGFASTGRDGDRPALVVGCDGAGCVARVVPALPE